MSSSFFLSIIIIFCGFFTKITWSKKTCLVFFVHFHSASAKIAPLSSGLSSYLWVPYDVKDCGSLFEMCVKTRVSRRCASRNQNVQWHVLRLCRAWGLRYRYGMISVIQTKLILCMAFHSQHNIRILSNTEILSSTIIYLLSLLPM